VSSKHREKAYIPTLLENSRSRNFVPLPFQFRGEHPIA
jgi:hypothetical protein